MRLLILSDSHGGYSVMDRIIRNEKEAEHIFFLGDVLSDIENLVFEYTDRKFYSVKGNCDFFSDKREFDIIDIAGVKIFMTHGHNYGVNGGTEGLLCAALNCGADIALYGHTHIPLIKYEKGVHIVNPGSVTKSREGANSYAVIDMTDAGILVAIKRI